MRHPAECQTVRRSNAHQAHQGCMCCEHSRECSAARDGATGSTDTHMDTMSATVRAPPSRSTGTVATDSASHQHQQRGSQARETPFRLDVDSTGNDLRIARLRAINDLAQLWKCAPQQQRAIFRQLHCTALAAQCIDDQRIAFARHPWVCRGCQAETASRYSEKALYRTVLHRWSPD